MTDAEPDGVRAALEAAFRRVAPQAGANDLDAAASAILATASHDTPDRFHIEADGAVRELDDAMKALDRLKSKLSALHGVSRMEVGVAAGSNSNAYEASVYGQLMRLADDLGTARDRIARQGLLHLRPHSRAQHVAEAVAYWLAKLTGRSPGVSKNDNNQVKGPFVLLLIAAFTATGITANIESEARKAAADWKRRRRQRDTAP